MCYSPLPVTDWAHLRSTQGSACCVVLPTSPFRFLFSSFYPFCSLSPSSPFWWEGDRVSCVSGWLQGHCVAKVTFLSSSLFLQCWGYGAGTATPRLWNAGVKPRPPSMLGEHSSDSGEHSSDLARPPPLCFLNCSDEKSFSQEDKFLCPSQSSYEHRGVGLSYTPWPPLSGRDQIILHHSTE